MAPAKTTLLILADDLTGAADSAARCAKAGLRADISLVAPRPPLAPATAFTSDSRHLPPTAAAARVRSLAAPLRELPDVVWYKKIDSTLRGNLGAELQALLEVLGRKRAIVCPAFPEQARGLHKGALVYTGLQGEPPHLPSLLGEQSALAVAAIDLADVRRGPEELAARLAATTVPLIVVDALDGDDLDAIVQAARDSIPDALLCGSAGLAGALARRCRALLGPAEQPPVAPRLRGGPILFVVGSGSEVAWRQAAKLCAGAPVVAREPGARHDEIGGEDVLVRMPRPAEGATLDGPEARAFAELLADEVTELISRLQPAALVLVGGDTAIAVLGRLGVTRLRVLDELLPGMPRTAGEDAAGRTYTVVLKAGNHGDEEALLTLRGLIR